MNSDNKAPSDQVRTAPDLERSGRDVTGSNGAAMNGGTEQKHETNQSRVQV